MVAEPIEPGLVGGVIDAETELHAAGPAGFEPEVADLIGRADRQLAAVEIGRVRRTLPIRLVEQVTPPALGGIEPHDGCLPGQVVQLLAAAADQIYRHPIHQHDKGPRLDAEGIDRQQIPGLAVGAIGKRRGHRQHATLAQRPFEHCRPAVAVLQHDADAFRQRAQLPVTEDRKGVPGDRTGLAAKRGEDGVLEIARGQVQIALGPRSLPQQLARQEGLGLAGSLNESTGEAFRPRKIATPCPSAA